MQYPSYQTKNKPSYQNKNETMFIQIITRPNLCSKKTVSILIFQTYIQKLKILNNHSYWAYLGLYDLLINTYM